MLVKRLLLNRRGQILSIDLIFSIVIFLVILGISVNLWTGNLLEFKANQDRIDLQRLSLQVSDLLIKNGGRPDNWEKDASGLVVLGLANESHILDINKVGNFTNLSHTTVTERLGIKGLYIYFELKSQNGAVIESTGVNVGKNSTNSVSVSRNVMYNNSPSNMIITLWSD